MPICEADPWRMQYFAAIPCPDDVRIPTEDADAWLWYPRYRWIYDKLAVALSQGLEAGPHGVMPARFPVFSKPIVNLRGMGMGSRVIVDADDYQRALSPGHFWMQLLEGQHVSTDVALLEGQPVWWRHATGNPAGHGMFTHWTIHAEANAEIENHCRAWLEKHLAGYTGLANLETIGGTIIEVHLRFADQWPDLYGEGWVAAMINLYAGKGWHFADRDRRNGYSLALFGPNGRRYRHPPPAIIAAVTNRAGVSSLQITFHEDRAPEHHAMPPGGFRLAIVNGTDFAPCDAARDMLRRYFLGEAPAVNLSGKHS